MPILPHPRLPAPPLIVAVCIPQTSQAGTFKRIERLERPPLPKYLLARQIFNAVLGGESLEWTCKEAKAHLDRQQSRHALELLKTCKSYLEANRGSRISGFGSMSLDLGGDLMLPVSIDARLATPEGGRAVAYHFWRTPLTEEQERLAFSIGREVLWRQPGCAGLPFELVTAPFRPTLKRRSLRVVTEKKVRLSTDAEIKHFKTAFAAHWDAYHAAHPTRRWAHNRK